MLMNAAVQSGLSLIPRYAPIPKISNPKILAKSMNHRFPNAMKISYLLLIVVAIRSITVLALLPR